MKEMQKIADNIIKTEYDCPSRHPELGYKVPVLDLAVWVEETDVAAPGLESQELHGHCNNNDICLPIGEPRAAEQPSNLESYTPPVHRGCAPGVSFHNQLDAQLIQPLGSQEQFLDSDDVSAPHPIPSCPPPWSPLPSRPCSSATAQSQGELLATRTSGAASQVVGQLPPIIINQSVLHNPSIPGECTRSFKFQFNSTQSNPTQFIIIMIRNRTNPTTRKPVFLCLPISKDTQRRWRRRGSSATSLPNGGAPTLEAPLAFSEGQTRKAEEEGESPGRRSRGRWRMEDGVKSWMIQHTNFCESFRHCFFSRHFESRSFCFTFTVVVRTKL